MIPAASSVFELSSFCLLKSGVKAKVGRSNRRSVSFIKTKSATTTSLLPEMTLRTGLQTGLQTGSKRECGERGKCGALNGNLEITKANEGTVHKISLEAPRSSAEIEETFSLLLLSLLPVFNE